jgi:glycosyltransferase involved in cell wall biosynthesis
MKVLLVGNYLPDRQESMIRFSNLMHRGLCKAGIAATLVTPPERMGKMAPHFLQKWFGYVDKFLLFPRRLRKLAVDADIIHVCDHSNAMYVPKTDRATVVTCHDLLAVRGAMGEVDDCAASFTGKWLQRWIVEGLREAAVIACDSHSTEADVIRIIEAREREIPTPVIPLGLCYAYRPLPEAESARRLQAGGLDLSKPFVLHVGSSHKRKNREAIIRIAALTKKSFPGRYVFAGAPLTGVQRGQAVAAGVSDCITELGSISNEVLEALYSRAHCMLFPSRFEGFGWPVIEAQSCRCPVIVSDQCSLPEVAGDGAIICEINDERRMADAVIELQEPERRKDIIERGAANLARFSEDTMVQRYIEIYRTVMEANS